MPQREWPDSRQPMDRGLMSLLESQRPAVAPPLMIHLVQSPPLVACKHLIPCIILHVRTCVQTKQPHQANTCSFLAEQGGGCAVKAEN